jgi:hypothetical protein
MIRQETGKQFDPNLATIFLDLHPTQVSPSWGTP